MSKKWFLALFVAWELIMTNFIKSFLTDTSGAAAAEYALILAVVGSVIAVAAGALAVAIGDSIDGATAVVAAHTPS